MKEVLIKFLKHWNKRNYEKMYGICQKTWQAKHTKGELRAMFAGLELSSFRVIVEVEISDCCSEITCDVTVNGEAKKIQARIISESAPYKTSISGNKGVNPISVIRLV